MRRAIAAAEVGDEQRGEDPSVNLLEARAAALLGHEAAIFLPTASMANQIAINILSQPGEELIAEELAHVVRYEAGGPAFHSGLVIRRIAGRRGLFGPEDVTPLVNDPAILHLAPTRVLSIENTSNGGGGVVWPLQLARDVCAEGRRHGLALHLDGARLLNASVASGVPAADYGREFDTVTLCLSKGLGCPLGALLAGSRELMARARRLKHLFGGAMRQAGIVAAAGVYALDHNVERLVDDHRRARRLAEAWAAAGLAVDVDRTETNFVQIDVTPLGLATHAAIERAAAGAVAVSGNVRPGLLRAVTHLDVSDEDVEVAAEALPRALAVPVRV